MPEDLIDVAQKKSTLEAYFELNQRDPQARELHYWEIPETYTWYGKEGRWERARRFTKKVARIYGVSPMQPELFHLR